MMTYQRVRDRRTWKFFLRFGFLILLRCLQPTNNLRQSAARQEDVLSLAGAERKEFPIIMEARILPQKQQENLWHLDVFRTFEHAY